MSVKIRLKRVGKKKQPMYRVVVADSRAPRDGKNIENIGTFDPGAKGGVKLKLDRADYWMKKGALPSATVKELLKTARKAANAEVL